MKTRCLILIICGLGLVFPYSCENNKNELPEIVYKDSLGTIVTNDTTEVVSNSDYELFVETRYDSSKPEYLIKHKNDLTDITVSDILNITRHGWNGETRLNFENAKLNINFPDTIYKNGDIIQIITRINTFSDGIITKSKYYKIEL